MEMLLLALAIAVGFIALAWSADRFVAGASAIARALGVSSMLIGLTVVGIGTSLPEMLVSAIAALDNTPGLALGNALGSNVANVGLIVGTTALLAPLAMHSRVLRREFPVLLGVVAITGLLLIDAQLSRAEGFGLLAGMIGVLIWMGWQSTRSSSESDPIAREIDAALPQAQPLIQSVTQALIALVVLLISSRVLVWSAVGLAEQIGVSDLVIGLTIVAVGTSLPELAAAIASVRRGDDDLAIGNIIGSNLFNLLGVLGIAAVITPFAVDGMSLARDYGIMTAFMLALVIVGFGIGRRGHIARLEGGLLFAAFIAYQGLLFTMGQ